MPTLYPPPASILLLVCLSSIGCAVGGGAEGDGNSNGATTGGMQDSGLPEGGTNGLGDAMPTTGGDAMTTATPDATTPDGSMDGGGDGQADAMPDPPMDSGADADVMVGSGQCPTTLTCETAREMAPVSGKQGEDQAIAEGTTSDFLQIKVTDASGVPSGPIDARFTLTSEGGANYDLFVRKPDDAGDNATEPRDCSAPVMASQNTMEEPDVLNVTWEDEWPNASGQDDGLILSVEIVHMSGPCGSWSLTVDGNVN